MSLWRVPRSSQTVRNEAGRGQVPTGRRPEAPVARVNMGIDLGRPDSRRRRGSSRSRSRHLVRLRSEFGSHAFGSARGRDAPNQAAFFVGVEVDQRGHLNGARIKGSRSPGIFCMREMSGRKILSLLGLAASFGPAAPSMLLTEADAEAQTGGMERRQQRRTGRTERRQDRRY